MRRILTFLLFLTFIGISPHLLIAQQDEDPAEYPGENPAEIVEEGGVEGTNPAYEYTEPDFGENRTSYLMLVLRTVAVLSVIIIGIYLIFRFLLKNKNRLVADTDMIKVLATYPLATNRLIKVVDIAGKVLILGVTDSNINLITSIEDKEMLDKIKLMSSKQSFERGSFKDQLLKIIGGKAFSKAGEVSYLKGYKNRINRMRKM